MERTGTANTMVSQQNYHGAQYRELFTVESPMIASSCQAGPRLIGPEIRHSPLIQAGRGSESVSDAVLKLDWSGQNPTLSRPSLDHTHLGLPWTTPTLVDRGVIASLLDCDTCCFLSCSLLNPHIPSSMSVPPDTYHSLPVPVSDIKRTAAKAVSDPNGRRFHSD